MVFVYLVDTFGGSEREVCYWKCEAHKFANKEATYQWCPLSANQVLNVAEVHDTGMVQIKLSIHKQEVEVSAPSAEEKAKTPQKKKSKD